MATVKITVTLEAKQVNEIRALVAAGQASSMSNFVQHAVKLALEDAAGWNDMIEDALEQTGGPLTAKERAWADEILSSHGRKKPSKSKKVA